MALSASGWPYGGSSGMASTLQQQQQQGQQVNPDYEVPPAVQDSVSSLNFSPAQNTANYLVATTWAGQVLCWEVQAQQGPGLDQYNFAATPKAFKQHELPLDANWLPDGSKVVTGGGDATVKLWDLGSGQQVDIGKHDAPVRAVCPLSPQLGSIVATSGYDKKIKYWDLRTNAAAAELALKSNPCAMDAKDALLVVALHGDPAATAALASGAKKVSEVQVVDLRKPAGPFPNERGHQFELSETSRMHPGMGIEEVKISNQLRCIACFPDSNGYLVGSAEGRVGVQNFKPYAMSREPKQDSYTFKCHRRCLDMQLRVTEMKKPPGSRDAVFEEAYAVNVIRFNPASGTFVTAGSDGSYAFWDKNEKQRLSKPSRSDGSPITAAAFHSSGQWLAYATGADWSQGYSHHDPSNAAMAPKVRIHGLTHDQIHRKPRK